MCSTWLLNDGPDVLGGPSVINSSDYESLFKHKPKVLLAGSSIEEDYEQWVFGMVDTSHNPSLGCMQLVDTRDAATLFQYIKSPYRKDSV